jgi:aminoglycoside phosphotransferase (APT) family kinase protein
MEGVGRSQGVERAGGSAPSDLGAGERASVGLASLEPWLRARLPAARPPFRLERLAGGRSNLTFLLADAAGGEWVLRRPPLGPRQATAHDVLREGRIMAALGPTAVPVPAILGAEDGLCPDGAPLLLMERAPGVAVRGAATAPEAAAPRAAAPEAAAAEAVGAAPHRSATTIESSLAPPARARAGLALAEALAALHAVDPAAVDLIDLGRGEGYIERQLARWNRQWAEGRTRELDDLAATHALLAARVPPQPQTAIVHGDFRLDNCLLDPAGEVTAVLDWEICTLGDPLADLGLLLVYWAEPGDEVTALEDPPTLAPRFATRAEVRRRYEAAAEIDASALDFYEAFAWWKLACIVEGVYARVSRGALGAVDRPAESFAAQAERLAAEARRSAEGLA